MSAPDAAVAQYYDQTLRHYRFLWDMDRSQALHYGFWSPGVRNLPEALREENRWLADRLELDPDSVVLDAGCGVGGSSLYLARRFGCRVVGITLSTAQLQLCRENARAAGLEDRVSFELMDFQHTRFEAGSFDAAWFIESFCHSPDKAALLQEMHRVLRPGGQLIVADYFRREPAQSGDEALLHEWLSGWQVHGIESASWMNAALQAAGFAQPRQQDVTALVMPSSRRLYRASFPARAILALRRLWGVRKVVSDANVRAARCQYRVFREGRASYAVFEARKPS